MTTSIDTYLKMGSIHKMNEDYVVHQDSVVVLSDGCSSGQYTSVGSRLLAHACIDEQSHYSMEGLNNAKNVAEILGLPESSLFCTLLTLRADDDRIRVTLEGDGCIVSRRANSHRDKGRDKYEDEEGSSFEFFNLEFVSGAPYYPVYSLNGQKDSYLQEFGQKIRINGVEQDMGFFDLYPSGMVSFEYPTDTYDFVAVFSDGINSFINDDGEPIPFEEMAKKFCQHVNGFTDEFLQRRCRRVFKDMDAVGTYHYDDFSMGAVKIAKAD